jgi:hypothetical protein
LEQEEFTNTMRFGAAVDITKHEYHRKLELYDLKFTTFLGMKMTRVTTEF